MTRSWMITFVIGLSNSSAVAEVPEPILALKGFDPISLTEGKEVAGMESLEIRRGLYRYRFSTPENKRAFEARPDAYSIQFGGACGKMGPLSGNGNPDRFFVHKSRIYIFASEGCRDGFKRDPDKHIELPNPAPKGSEEQKKLGTELMKKVLVGFGGEEKIDQLKTLRTTTKLIYKQGDKEFIGINRITWAFPDQIRVEDDFGTIYGYVVTPKGGFLFGRKQNWEMESSVREVAWRDALREPLIMVMNRKSPDFVAISKGKEKVNGTEVELLEEGLHGATSTWSIDPPSGRILQIEYYARRGVVGDNVVKFSDFKDVDGIVLPQSRVIFFNNKEITSPKRQIESLQVNKEVKSDLFRQPK